MESTFRRVQLKSDYLKMPVNLVQYRGAVGKFHNRKFLNTKAVNKVFGHRYWMPTNSGTVLLLLIITLCAVLHKSSKTLKNISVGILLFNMLLNLKLPFLSILIMLCGDVEINPGPKTISQQAFSVCHWNLSSIIAHNFAKIFLLKGCVRYIFASFFFKCKREHLSK